MSYSFTFGPNGSYFLDTPYSWTAQGLPSDLRTQLYAEVEAVTHNVGLGPDGQWFYGRTTQHQGAKWSQTKDSINEAADSWFNDRSSAGDGTFQFAYGSGGDFVACSSQGATKWSAALPAAFCQAVRKCNPKIATLGVDNSYVLVGTNGPAQWDLKGKYDVLDQILRNNTTAIQMVALDPYVEGQYIVMFTNHMWRAQLPIAYSDTVTKAINEASQAQGKMEMEHTQIMMDGVRRQQRMMSQFYTDMGNIMSSRYS